MPSCPVCGTENPDVARFCLACDAALTAEPLREEREATKRVRDAESLLVG